MFNSVTKEIALLKITELGFTTEEVDWIKLVATTVFASEIRECKMWKDS